MTQPIHGGVSHTGTDDMIATQSLMEAADSIHDCVDEDMYEDVIKFIAYDCLNVDLPTLRDV
jgi:hypothetical protein